VSFGFTDPGGEPGMASDRRPELGCVCWARDLLICLNFMQVEVTRSIARWSRLAPDRT
jgi:hypothetical protein